MENPKKASQELSLAAPTVPESSVIHPLGEFNQVVLKKLRGGLFLTVGYLLSPLCWWNDLLFNLPIAYFFGYICSRFSPELLLPCSIVGYWLSNIVGILLMQAGTVDLFQEQTKERNLKKELLTGFASSTVYTLVILALIHFKILDTPIPFPGS